MAQCVQCGRELPSFTWGELHDTCADCRKTRSAAAATAAPTFTTPLSQFSQVTVQNSTLASSPDQPVALRRKLPTPYVTYTLVGLCVAVFVAMVMKGISPTSPTVDQLRNWGATFGPYTFGGQPWRLVTSIFLHIGLLHLAFNMWCLWDLGQLAEFVLGRRALAALFLLTGISGALASSAMHPMVTGAGASGAIFGVAGALIAVFYLGKGHHPALKSTLRSLLAFAGYNLFFGAVSPHIDNAAHIGGLIGGLMIGGGLVVARRRAEPVYGEEARTSVAPAYVFVIFALALLLAGTLIARRSSAVVRVYRGEAALTGGRTDEAIAHLQRAVAQNPNFMPGHWLLAQAYLSKNDYAAAEPELRKVVNYDPKFAEGRFRLGMACLMQGKLDDAEVQFLELEKRNPRDPNAQTGYGLLATMRDDYDFAFQAYRKAAQLAPNDASAWYNLGLAAMQVKRYDDAARALQTALKLQPDNEKTKQKLQEARTAMGKAATSTEAAE